MGEPLAEKIETMLTSVQERVDDPELAFKIRTARQLVVIYDEQLRRQRDALDEEDLDQEARESLRRLGYLD